MGRSADVPAWPRGLQLETAAAYVGLPPGTFSDEVKKGVWPHPTRHGTYVIWDRHALDRAFDVLSHATTFAQDPQALLEAHGMPKPRRRERPAAVLHDRNTVRMVAEYWQLTTGAVHGRIKRGELECLRIGGTIRITREQVAAYEMSRVEHPMRGEAATIAMRDRLNGERLMARARAEGARKRALVVR